MDIITQLLVVLVLWMPDGSYQTSATPVPECPNIALFSGMMESRRDTGEIKSWVAWCTPAEFGVSKGRPVSTRRRFESGVE